MMAYNTTKVLDNFWITSGGTDAAAPIAWLFEGQIGIRRCLHILMLASLE